jgi:hypothetical protein
MIVCDGASVPISPGGAGFFEAIAGRGGVKQYKHETGMYIQLFCLLNGGMIEFIWRLRTTIEKYILIYEQ